MTPAACSSAAAGCAAWRRRRASCGRAAPPPPPAAAASARSPAPAGRAAPPPRGRAAPRAPSALASAAAPAAPAAAAAAGSGAGAPAPFAYGSGLSQGPREDQEDAISVQPVTLPGGYLYAGARRRGALRLRGKLAKRGVKKRVHFFCVTRVRERLTLLPLPRCVRVQRCLTATAAPPRPRTCNKICTPCCSARWSRCVAPRLRAGEPLTCRRCLRGAPQACRR
jgi:hypothetical protein